MAAYPKFDHRQFVQPVLDIFTYSRSYVHSRFYTKGILQEVHGILRYNDLGYIPIGDKACWVQSYHDV